MGTTPYFLQEEVAVTAIRFLRETEMVKRQALPPWSSAFILLCLPTLSLDHLGAYSNPLILQTRKGGLERTLTQGHMERGPSEPSLVPSLLPPSPALSL